MRDNVPRVADVEYTDVDLNTDATTTVYDSDVEAEVYGVYLLNGGSTAEVNLEVTDGTDTAILTQPGAGGSVEFDGAIRLNSDNSLQINVTTVEGAAQTNTCAVSRSEQ